MRDNWILSCPAASWEKKSIKIIDHDMTICRALIKAFPSLDVLCVTEYNSVLRREMENADVYISLTGDDEKIL